MNLDPYYFSSDVSCEIIMNITYLRIKEFFSFIGPRARESTLLEHSKVARLTREFTLSIRRCYGKVKKKKLQTNKRGFFHNLNNWFCFSVVGLSFVLLHLGVDASSPLNFGGELLDGKGEGMR